MAWPWIDAEPYRPVLSSDIEPRDQDAILDTVQPNWDSLSTHDKEAVSSLYEGMDPCAALTYELKRNLWLSKTSDSEDARLSYKNWKRTGRFQKLVELGFLATPSRDTIGAMCGAQILTAKWATFLWINLWEFTISEEILYRQEEVRYAVDSLLNLQKFLPFYAYLINTTSLPHIIPNELGCYGIQTLFSTMQQMIYTWDSLQGKWWIHLDHEGIELLKKLWWLKEDTDGSSLLKEVLTETGKRLLDDYEKLFPGEGRDRVENSRESLSRTIQEVTMNGPAKRLDAEDELYWVAVVEYDYT